ncbi:D-amino acid dehydrogenase small subunit [Paraburkholderia tropica]|uniref:D-amino acid dehydrogenase small subunit n=3 Tax=Paraburkholderia TaxID=1822464 RepID=A0ABX5MD97_9BURK|nr:D-amino acid dehydrogenase small subunit [Paraburkholderia tropica]PZW70591.1 D-amino acid dehydrogenase small subunit [Paraburkholderia tropica]
MRGRSGERRLVRPPKGSHRRNATGTVAKLSGKRTDGASASATHIAGDAQYNLDQNMSRIAIIGAGITGVTTAYALSNHGHSVSVFERHRYAAMETSFANGGQLSASNAEVWNSRATVLKGLRWMFARDAPLLLNPRPSLHKYGWIAEFLGNIPRYEANTIETVRLAIAARAHLFHIAEREGIQFDLEQRGILHFYATRKEHEAAMRVNTLLRAGGLDRRPVTPEEMRAIEPTLHGRFHGGFFTESDSSGDIHKFTGGLSSACERRGVQFHYDTAIDSVESVDCGKILISSDQRREVFDRIVICAGVGSRRFAAMLGDHVNVYPVKGYSITVHLDDEPSRSSAPWVSILDDRAKIVTSRLGTDRFRVAGTAEFNGVNRDIRSDRIEPLINWVRRYFPVVSTSRVIPWAGLRPMLPSMLPRVGRGRRPGVFYNTGHGHLGWTLSAATAEAVSSMIGVD